MRTEIMWERAAFNKHSEALNVTWFPTPHPCHPLHHLMLLAIWALGEMVGIPPSIPHVKLLYVRFRARPWFSVSIDRTLQGGLHSVGTLQLGAVGKRNGLMERAGNRYASWLSCLLTLPGQQVKSPLWTWAACNSEKGRFQYPRQRNREKSAYAQSSIYPRWGLRSDEFHWEVSFLATYIQITFHLWIFATALFFGDCLSCCVATP